MDVPPERERQVCWQIYSIVTDMYRPNPERLKDWISIPKSNGMRVCIRPYSDRRTAG